MSRGRDASRPSQIPARGLIDVLMRIWSRQGDANMGLIAAGIAFYGLLSLFPGITAGVALAGMFMERDVLVENSAEIAAVLPEAASEIILGQLREVASADETALGIAALVALGIALFSASRALSNFVAGLNVVYEEKETRGFIHLTALNLGLTLTMLVGIIFAVVIVAAIPAIANFLGGMPLVTEIIFLARWPILFLFGAGGFAVLYRFGPDRRAARWRWLTPGALIACLLWVLGTIGFSLYVQAFGSYNETFGALGGVIILLTWLWLSAFIVLFGALIDAELEAQTMRDSTVGKPRPIGERGAHKADNIGPARDQRA